MGHLPYRYSMGFTDYKYQIPRELFGPNYYLLNHNSVFLLWQIKN